MQEPRDHHEGDAAAYALGALEPQEAEAFARHLETCTICREELRIYEQVAEALPATVPQYEAPRSLRRRVLREVEADARQRRAQHGRADGERRAGWLPGGIGPTRRPGFVGLAVAGVAAATLAVVLLVTSGSTGARLVQATVSGASGSAQVRLQGGHGELIVHHLPAPRTGHIYEMWLQHGDQQPSPTRALFSVTAGGAANIAVPGRLSGVSALMVTQEPAGGSRIPTTPPVIVARLS